MDEKDFALLAALKEHASITHAADRLYLTQSALSKRIKAIEQELGCGIVIRSRKGVRFTPQGELVLEHAMRAQDELTELRRELDASHDEVRGTIRAGFSINYAAAHLSDLLVEYHRRYPLVRLHVTCEQSYKLHASLQNGDLDIAVLRGELPWDGMQYLLKQERICAVCAREHAEVPLSELPYISHKTDSAQTALMMRWLHENGLARDAEEICVDNLGVCADLVRAGIGWALLPEIALTGFDGCIRPCTFANGEPFVRRMYIDCQTSAEQLPQVERLVELMKEHAARTL